MFCAGYDLYFSRYAFPLNSNDFSDETFFLQLHLLLVFPSCWVIYHLIFRDISLKSQEFFCSIFCCISFNIQWILFCFNLFSLNYSLSHPIIFVYLFVIIRYLFVISLAPLLFVLSLLSCLAVFIYYFVFFVFVKLC